MACESIDTIVGNIKTNPTDTTNPTTLEDLAVRACVIKGENETGAQPPDTFTATMSDKAKYPHLFDYITDDGKDKKINMGKWYEKDGKTYTKELSTVISRLGVGETLRAIKAIEGSNKNQEEQQKEINALLAQKPPLHKDIYLKLYRVESLMLSEKNEGYDTDGDPLQISDDDVGAYTDQKFKDKKGEKGEAPKSEEELKELKKSVDAEVVKSINAFQLVAKKILEGDGDSTPAVQKVTIPKTEHDNLKAAAAQLTAAQKAKTDAEAAKTEAETAKNNAETAKKNVAKERDELRSERGLAKGVAIGTAIVAAVVFGVRFLIRKFSRRP